MKKRNSAVLLSAVLLGTIAFLARDPILQAVGDYLIIEDELKPVDVIHVIAGNDYRTEYAIQLYKQGYAKTIFFTGGWCTFHNYYHGEHGRELAVSEGVPSEATATDELTVTSTYNEAERLKAWIDQSPVPVRSVMVVSDPFHMRRSRWTYRRVLGKGVEVVMAPVLFERTPFIRRWWEDDDLWKLVKDEYLKLVYYVMRYQLASGRFQEWLAAFDQG